MTHKFPSAWRLLAIAAIFLVQWACHGTAAAADRNGKVYYNEFSAFINLHGQYEEWPEFIPDDYKCSAMSITVKGDRILVIDSTYSAVTRFIGVHARFTSWVANGNDRDFVQHMRRRLRQHLFDDLGSMWNKAADYNDKQLSRDQLTKMFYGGNQTKFSDLVTISKPAVSPWMGDDTAELIEADAAFWKNKMLQIIGIPYGVRFKLRNYYDAKANKTVVVLFSQFYFKTGLKQEASPATQASKAFFDLMTSMGCTRNYVKAINNYIRDFKEFDLEGSFETLFNLREGHVTCTGATGGKPEPPQKPKQPTGTNPPADTPQPEDPLPPVICLPPIIGTPPPTIDTQNKPVTGHGRAIETRGTVYDIAESHQALLALLSNGRVLKIDKATGQSSIVDGQKRNITSITATDEGTLLGYEPHKGLVDYASNAVIWTPEDQNQRFSLATNPVTGEIAAHSDQWIVTMDAMGDEHAAYDVTGSGNVAYDADGALWCSVADKGYARSHSGETVGENITFGNSSSILWLGCGRNGRIMAITHEGVWSLDPATSATTLLCPSRGENTALRMLAYNADECFALNTANNTIHVFNGEIGPSGHTTITTPDHFGTGVARSAIKFIYADSLGNLWIATATGLSAYHNGGIRGYGNFNGVIDTTIK